VETDKMKMKRQLMNLDQAKKQKIRICTRNWSRCKNRAKNRY
jgi:hypothetical protein